MTTTTTTHTHSYRKRRSHSKGTVPFAWENKPGVSKLSHAKTEPITKAEYYFVKDDYKLPPPPPRVSIHGDYQLPLPPPRSFQPLLSKNSSMKGLISSRLTHETEDDPFQVAIIECTKSSHESSGAADSTKVNSNTTSQSSLSPSRPFYKGGFRSGVRDLFESMSCKCSSSVRVPYLRDTRLNI